MKTKINQGLYILFMIVLPIAGYSWQIVEPRGNTVQKCQSINICWEYFDSSTDQYRINLYYKPTSYYVANNKVTLGETLQYSWVNVEDWAWGDVSRCIGDITISKNWSTDGEIRIEVIAQDEEFNVWGANTFETQAITEKIYAIDGPVVSKPSQLNVTLCEPKWHTIKIPSSNPNNTIYWYRSLTGNDLEFKGSEFTAYYTSGFKLWYVAEHSNAHGCEYESARSLVAVTTFPKVTSLATESYEIMHEPDARMQESSCSRAGTYQLLGNKQTPFSIPDPGISGFSFTTSSKGANWRDAQYYSYANDLAKVCNSHLPAGPGTSRLYYQDLDLQVNWKIEQVQTPKLPYSNPIIIFEGASSNSTCNIPNYRTAKVAKSKVCAPLFDNDIHKIYGSQLSECGTNVDHITICPVDNALKIGPDDNSYNDFNSGQLKYPKTTHTFSWNSDQPGNDGLSNNSVKNPSINYSAINLPQGYRYIKYTCTIQKTVVAGSPTTVKPVVSTEKYCVIVYKCPDCPDGNRPAMEEEALVNNHSLGINPSLSSKQFALKLFPNPANTELTISFEHEQHSDDAYVSITDLRGHLIDQFPLKTDHGSETINISNIKNGTYIANLYIEGQKKGSQLLLINH